MAKLSLKKMSVSELVSLRDRIQSALSERIEQVLKAWHSARKRVVTLFRDTALREKYQPAAGTTFVAADPKPA